MHRPTDRPPSGGTGGGAADERSGGAASGARRGPGKRWALGEWGVTPGSARVVMPEDATPGGGHPDPFATRREAMVRYQIRAGGITDEAVLDAFAAVPRERFVPTELVERAYDDSALGIGNGQTISQPYIVAVMTDALELPSWLKAHPGLHPHVLDVGTGSGYQAAILAELGATVISIERDQNLSSAAEQRLADLGYADRIRCVVGDGSLGWLDQAPYEGIVVGAAAPVVPEPLVSQLADGGRLVIPVGRRERQDLRVVRRIGKRIDEQYLDPCVFVPLVGEYGFAR